MYWKFSGILELFLAYLAWKKVLKGALDNYFENLANNWKFLKKRPAYFAI